MNKKIKFYSCLVDKGANIIGSANGPIFIKNKLIEKKLFTNLDFSEYQSLEENDIKNIKETINRCGEDYKRSINKDFPILLGGDHSVAMASIKEINEYCLNHKKKLYIFWFDAHADINTYEDSETKNIHGMPVAMLSGLDKTNLIINTNNYIDLNNFYLFGARSIDKKEKETLNKYQIKNSLNILESLNTIKKIIKESDKNSYFHISFDIDCLDPIEASGVSTPEDDGFKEKEALQLLNLLLEDKRTLSLDIVEYNPINDNVNQDTLNIVIKIINLIKTKKER